MSDMAERLALHEFTENAYLNYSMYVIMDRALPFIGDGLKPVQRRIVYAMSELGLPYLSGERTPHNNPQAKGVFFGLTHQHGPNELARAVLEGVGYALADGMDVVHACGIKPQSVTLIGGGARSEYWRQMLADISGQQLDYRTGGDVGPALGAARLAQIAANPEKSLIELLPQLPLEQSHLPDAQRYAAYQPRRETFRRLYQQLLPLMA